MVLSESLPSTDFSVLARRLNRFLAGWLRNLFEEVFGASVFSDATSFASSVTAGVVFENRDPLVRDDPNDGLLNRFFTDVASAGDSVVVVLPLPWNLKRFELRPADKAPRPLAVTASVVVDCVVGASVVVVVVVVD